MAPYPFVRRARLAAALSCALLLTTTGSKSNCIPMEPEPAECADNADCLDDAQYCERAVGDCDGFGVCEPRPDVCPEVWAPVCGCDGQTWGNRCEAAAAGVSVDHDGACEPPPPPPPDECETNADCRGIETDAEARSREAYCAKAPGDCDGVGVCAPRPDACVDLWDPVCGCDGRTYGNECYAAAAGVNVDHDGECAPEPPPPEACETNADCRLSWSDPRVADGGLYCAKRVGDCDGEGRCEPRPDACPDVWRPVCGCDGRTYGNACEAAAAGENVAHEGACEPPPDEGCRTNADCEDAVEPGTDARPYCAKRVGDCDGLGRCAPRPRYCIMLYDPVCGCDGRTYSNACVAAGAGVNVEHEGACAADRAR